MSTRCYIAKQIEEDKFQTIYCHCDGYLRHNGRMLLDHYNTPEQVAALIALGDISFLDERLNPDPDSPHSFQYGQRQDGVTLAYGRDRGEKGTEAKIMSLAQLDDPDNWSEYVYIFTQENQWKYFEAGKSQEGLRDVREDLAALLDRSDNLMQSM